ncbi:MAG: c-type cytochrome domain-containing protein, partial [Gemmataceae bacterium]
MLNKRVVLNILASYFLLDALSNFAKAEDFTFFESNIRPILIEHCYECHAEGKKVRGGLLVDSKEALLKGGDTGPAIVPGNPDKSLLMKAILYQGDLKMPPKGKLSATAINNIKEWIAKGASDPRENKSKTTTEAIDWDKSKNFWAFKPIKDTKPNTAKNTSSLIDTFISNQLVAKGLSKSIQATPNELIRRLSFTLTG